MVAVREHRDSPTLTRHRTLADSWRVESDQPAKTCRLPEPGSGRGIRFEFSSTGGRRGCCACSGDRRAEWVIGGSLPSSSMDTEELNSQPAVAHADDEIAAAHDRNRRWAWIIGIATAGTIGLILASAAALYFAAPAETSARITGAWAPSATVMHSAAQW